MILCIFHTNSSHMKFIYTFFQKFCHKSSNFQLYIFRTISNLALFFIFYRIVTTKKGTENRCLKLLLLLAESFFKSLELVVHNSRNALANLFCFTQFGLFLCLWVFSFFFRFIQLTSNLLSFIKLIYWNYIFKNDIHFTFRRNIIRNIYC